MASLCFLSQGAISDDLESPRRATCSGRTPTVFWRWSMSKRFLLMPLLYSSRKGRNCPPLSAATEEDLQSGVSQQKGEDHWGGGCVRSIVGFVRGTPLPPSGCWVIFGLLAAFLPPLLPYTLRLTIDTTTVYGCSDGLSLRQQKRGKIRQ